MTREEAIKDIEENILPIVGGKSLRMAIDALRQPERKKGTWIPQNLNKSDGMISTAVYYYPKCSVCGASANYTNFCPNCGAEMTEGEG